MLKLSFMRDDSSPITDLDLQPLPCMLVNPQHDRIVCLNQSAGALFGEKAESGAFSQLVLSPLADVAVYFDAIAHFGKYTDRTITLKNGANNPLRLQTFGIQKNDQDVLLSFLDLDELERQSERAEQEAHHRGGLMQWQKIHGFFREMEAQNHLILEAAGEGIYGINAEGKATFVNRAAQEMLGWNAEDLIGRELHSIIHHKHLNGDHFPAQSCPIYNSFRGDKTVRVDDDTFWRKDGKPIRVDYVSTPIYDHGVLAGAVVIFRDITDRLENEKRLRSALQEVETLRDQLELENDYLQTEIRAVRSHTGILGQSPSIRNLNAQIDLVADTKTNVLISGPTGTGKSLVVSAIHEASKRRKRPLVRLNCSDVSVQDLEAELFGYRRGAFRGATRDTAGKLSLANNGTLHLDEVSDMPKEVQAKLLNVIQDKRFRRLGDNSEISVDLTIISTTSRDLVTEVEAGRFRKDLFFELNVFPLQCDPLKARVEDIPILAKFFLDRTARRLRLACPKLSRANVDALITYDWPGNVRELENVIERAAILAQGGKLRFDFQAPKLERGEFGSKLLTQEDLRMIERENIVRCLKRTKGKVSGARGAAQLLGIAPTTLYSKLKVFEISTKDCILGKTD